ncbi:LysR family transcriptional regulator [Celerinatantimonas sp. YJH-8]|uniref:LysR family transcriptional regulator n=1 Tax=Celerinatantimonas sp. YJH-8 TaxID=3228714 RepID=UPI0038C3F3B0
MNKNYNDLIAFISVAQQGSFTKAAAQIGVSQSALSHTIRGLESRMNVRLLNRTTRSVSPTEAGQYLLQTIAPKFAEIDYELEAVNLFKLSPAGTIRVTADDYSARSILWPKVKELVARYPEIKVEVDINYGFIDIVSERFDAGIRLGESLEQDMIAVPISPTMRMAVVAHPDYWQRNGSPETPHELMAHNCINFRLPTRGGLYAWEFEKEGKELAVRVQGQIVIESAESRIDAALEGLGVCYVPEAEILRYVEAGQLVRVLEDWCPPFEGFYLYYPNRRLASPAFQIFLDALRYHP